MSPLGDTLGIHENLFDLFSSVYIVIIKKTQAGSSYEFSKPTFFFPHSNT